MMLDTNLSEANAMFLTTQKVGQNTSTYNTSLYVTLANSLVDLS